MTESEWNRRDVVKAIGLGVGVSLFGAPVSMAQDDVDSLGSPNKYEYRKPDRPVTAIIIGAGGRGNVYSSYAPGHRDEWKIVGVAEPIPHRNERMARAHGIPDEHRVVTWEHIFEKPKFADVCVITTPDELHYGPAMAALEMGYDLLLEKVVAQTWRECKEILELATRKKRIVAGCHVMRYAPYFQQLRHVVQSGRIGEVVSVQHLEPVEHIHMSHSFVRGNWRNTAESNPMILSKSCHDLDILRWIIGKPCKKLSSFGSLKLFRKEMAPEGSTTRCTGGCKVEAHCPFSALTIYLRRKTYLHHLAVDEHTDEKILGALKEGPYGRCVYHCDNDVVDHQVTNIEFDEQITAGFSMEALTSYGGRRTRSMGTKGDIVGDERIMDVFDFSTRKRIRWDVTKHAGNLGGHGGGDHRLVRDFVQAVSRRDESLLTSNLAASMESHLMGFKAEKSRIEGGRVETVDIERM